MNKAINERPAAIVQKMFVKNVRLAFAYCGKFRGTPLYYDLFSVCLEALWKSCKTWDAGKGSLGNYFHFYAGGLVKNYFRSQARGGADVSLDVPLGGEDSETLGETIADPARPFTGDVELKILAEMALSAPKLKPRDREILVLMSRGYSGAEIAKKYGVTKQAINQATRKSLLICRGYLRRCGIRSIEDCLY